MLDGEQQRVHWAREPRGVGWTRRCCPRPPGGPPAPFRQSGTVPGSLMLPINQHSPVGRESPRMVETTLRWVHNVFLWAERSRAAKMVFLSPVQPLYGMTQFKFTSCMSVLYINKIKVIIKMGGYLGVSGEIKGRTLMSCDTRQWQCLVELRCTVGGRRLSACSTQRDGFGCTDPPIWLRLDPSDHAPTAAQTYVRWRRVTTSIPLRLVRCDIVSPTRGS